MNVTFTPSGAGIGRATALAVAGAFALGLVSTAALAQPKGEIVFKIDNSGSMGPDIADVKANVATIVSVLQGAGIDFQLGLVGFGQTANSGSPRIFTNLTADVTAFQAGLNSMVASGGNEPGFTATSVGEGGLADTAGVTMTGFRTGVPVCNVLITDEDADRDFNLGAPTLAGQKAQAIADLQANDAVFIGIVDLGFFNTANDYGPAPGSLAEQTDGQVFDILAFRQDPTAVITAVTEACVEVFTRVSKCYVAKNDPRGPQFAGAEVVLADQFTTTTASVDRLHGLCNPADKSLDAEPVEAPTSGQHLACYQISENGFAETTVDIESDNFGPQKLRLTKGVELCAPAEKTYAGNTQGRTQGTDFKCYAPISLAGGPASGQRVSLADQFGTTTDATIVTTARFCTQVTKNGTQAPEDPDHLVCYKTSGGVRANPDDPTFPFFDVVTSDQFQEGVSLEVAAENSFCEAARLIAVDGVPVAP